VYTLHVDAAQLRSLHGMQPFTARGLESQYWTTACECGGHGSCDEAGNCLCEDGYTGSHCHSCKPGYHRAGASCIADVRCTPTTCNGHGTCSDKDGFPVCDCDDAFTTVGTCTGSTVGSEDADSGVCR
jgi:hypothetical protein